MFRFFIPLILLVFSVMLYMGYTEPNLDRIADVRDDIELASSTLSVNKTQIQQKIKELQEIRNTVDAEAEEKVDRIAPSIDEFDHARFLYDINDIGYDNSMPLRSLAVSSLDPDALDRDKIRAGDGYVPITVSFSVTSTYTEFKEFLEVLERNVQLLDITSISFGEAGDAEDTTFQVAMNAYYWVP